MGLLSTIAQPIEVDPPLNGRTTSGGMVRPRGADWPIFSGAILLLFLMAGLFGPLIVRESPSYVNLSLSLKPPALFPGGSWANPLGTDAFGRDVLSRIVGGARVSLEVSLAVVFLSGTVGVLVAMAAGYLGGAVDTVLMRVTDAALAFPFLLLAIVVVGVFGPSLKVVIIVLALGGWAHYARVLRSEVLRLRTQDFVTMSNVMGAGLVWIAGRHLFPNILNTLLVLATVQVGLAVIAEGSLSFLGIGVPPPAPSWGGMLGEGRNYLTVAWWLPTLPGLAMSLVVLSANMMGDWLRQRNDPTGGN